MQTKEVEKEGHDYTGKDFLLKNDQKHQNLLAELNSKINKWQNEKSTNKKESEMKGIRKFIKNHYRTFIARMQEGISVDFIRNLLIDASKREEYYKQRLCCGARIQQSMLFLPSALIKEMRNRYITPVTYYDDKEKKRKVIFIDPNNQESLKKLNVINTNNPVKVYNHSRDFFKSNFFHEAIIDVKEGQERQTIVTPINDNLFSSFISSRQTTAVENACKIVNYLTKQHYDKTKNNLDLDIYGMCSGVDFATKMVGSGANKDNRIEKANITLHLDSPHILQNANDIVSRLRGINQTTKINSINVNRILNDPILHPKCQTDSLLEWLEYYQRHSNNKVEIKDLRTLGSNKQNAFY